MINLKEANTEWQQYFMQQLFGKDLNKRFPQETGKTTKINPDILPSSSGIGTGVNKMS